MPRHLKKVTISKNNCNLTDQVFFFFFQNSKSNYWEPYKKNIFVWSQKLWTAESRIIYVAGDEYTFASSIICTSVSLDNCTCHMCFINYWIYQRATGRNIQGTKGKLICTLEKLHISCPSLQALKLMTMQVMTFLIDDILGRRKKLIIKNLLKLYT
jgi:hypothetical protein